MNRTHELKARWILPVCFACLLPMMVTPTPAEEAGGYEMTTYVVGFLYKGPAWTGEASPELSKQQEGHLAHMDRMAESGKLILAGPFMDGGDLRGLVVFKLDGDSPEAMVAEAVRLSAEDPMIRSKHLMLRFHPWYSAKGITIDQTAAAN